MNSLKQTNDATSLSWRWDGFDGLTASELYAVLQRREEVFVIEQRCFYLDIDGLDTQCLHGRAMDHGGALAAYVRIVPPGLAFDEPSIGRVLVAPAWRGRGLGRVLMQQAVLATREAYPRSAIRISAQAHLTAFYRDLGFVAAGEVYDDAGIAHRDMLLDAVR